MASKYSRIFSFVAVLMFVTSCGGGGGGDGGFFFGGFWFARDLVLFAENCTESLSELTIRQSVEDFEYSVEQDGGAIVYTDEDGSFPGSADSDSFFVEAPNEGLGSVLDGTIECVGRGELTYTGTTSESGIVDLSAVIECLEPSSGATAFRCTIDYRGVSERQST